MEFCFISLREGDNVLLESKLLFNNRFFNLILVLLFLLCLIEKLNNSLPFE